MIIKTVEHFLQGLYPLQTLRLLQQLMVFIEGESHPLYRVELKHRPHRYAVDYSELLGCAMFLLFLIIPLLTILETVLGIRSAAVNMVTSVGAVGILGILLSLSWTVPITVVAGSIVTRERTAQTWDILLLMPFSGETIMLAKAAAALRPIWRLLVGVTIIGTLLGIVFCTPIVVNLVATNTQSLILGLLAGGLSVVVIGYEHLQECILALLIGLLIAVSNPQLRFSLLLTAFNGVLIRVVAMLMFIACLPNTPLNIKVLPAADSLLLNAIAGSSAMLTGTYWGGALLFIACMLILREVLINQMRRRMLEAVLV